MPCSTGTATRIFIHMNSASDPLPHRDESARRSIVKSRLWLGRGWAAYCGPIHQNRPHRHHLVQIVWSTLEPVLVMTEKGAVSAMGYVFDASASHSVVASCPVRLIYLDPALPKAKALRVQSKTGPAELDLPQIATLELEFQRWASHKQQLVADSLSRSDRAHAIHEWLQARLDRQVRAEEAAASVGLSEGRFLHWFADEHELPFRAYVRWLRLQMTLHCLARGETLTEAAHASGFADSAHLSRTFAAAFGVAPRQLLNADITIVADAGPNVDSIFGRPRDW